MISIKQAIFSFFLSGSLACGLNPGASACPQSYHSNLPGTKSSPLLVAYSYRYGTRNYKQSRRNYRKYGSYSRYRNSHRSGRYSHNYRRSHFRNYNSPDDVKSVKKKTVWEAPTSLDKKINEEIEKAQVNEGPTSKAAGDLMYKYAKRYYDTKDYEKAKKMTDRMIKLDDVSKFDGIKMSEVKKLRLDAIAKINGSTKKAKSNNHGPLYSMLGNKSQNSRPGYSPLTPSAPSSPSFRNSSSYSGSGQMLWSKFKHQYQPKKRSSTAIGRVLKKRNGVTEFDYSPSAVAQTRKKTISVSSSSSGGASSYPSPIKRKRYKYPGTVNARPYPISPRTFKYPNFRHFGEGRLEKLDSKFKKYQSN